MKLREKDPQSSWTGRLVLSACPVFRTFFGTADIQDFRAGKVNGVRLKCPTPLAHGDRVLVGCAGGFRVILPGAPESEDHALEDAIKEVSDDSAEVPGIFDCVRGY